MKRFCIFTLLISLLILTSSFAYANRFSHSRCNNPQGAFNCMACNCFNEAGNEGLKGQVAVGEVVMARVGSPHWPDTICGVIKQPKQFSWYNSVFTRKALPARHSCIEAAKKALSFRGCKADHYHATYVRPRWRTQMRRVEKIQTHIFYSKFCHKINIAEAMQKQNKAAGPRYSPNSENLIVAERIPTPTRTPTINRPRPKVRFATANPNDEGFFERFFGRSTGRVNL